ncbi:MAG: CPBP family intramembrane metalloprotease [Verrucomicrobia bacterium]|nr:CPBP family intramembrane metalloprotease [Verrucomicrobiota bacterium]MBS0636086.1 CPBP family intramembrane metalloprotease [Verrucomicrobiota bacterium]
MVFAVAGGLVHSLGLCYISFLAMLWVIYARKSSAFVFFAIVAYSTCFKLKLLAGFNPIFITSKFAMGLENPLVGLYPLALLVPLARDTQDWKAVLRGVGLSIVGVFLIAIAAVASGAVKLNFSILPFMGLRTFSNFVLTSIPEEAFYRGFVQNTLCTYFKNSRAGKISALLLTSLLFSATHLFWAPSVSILGFTFLASLLYGGIYLYTQKIESAIFCHFLLNFAHMTFFSYHAV